MDQRARCSYLRLTAVDVQHVLLRSMALDEYLNNNLVSDAHAPHTCLARPLEPNVFVCCFLLRSFASCVREILSFAVHPVVVLMRSLVRASLSSRMPSLWTAMQRLFTWRLGDCTIGEDGVTSWVGASR